MKATLTRYKELMNECEIVEFDVTERCTYRLSEKDTRGVDNQFGAERKA